MPPALLENPTELDAVSHRLERISRDAVRAEAIARGVLDATPLYVNRAITRLIEDRAMLTARVPLIAEGIALLPLDRQDEQVAQTLRPLTLAIEQEHIAIARLRSALS